MKRIVLDHRNYIIPELQEVALKYGLKMRVYQDAMNDWGLKRVILLRRDKDMEIFTDFQVQQMPGCCAVLTIFYVAPEKYNQNNFQLTLNWIEEAAKEAGFGSVQMAQVMDPKRGVKEEVWGLCLQNGWIMGEPFINAKSGNHVVYLTKNLGQVGKVEGLEQELVIKGE